MTHTTTVHTNGTRPVISRFARSIFDERRRELLMDLSDIAKILPVHTCDPGGIHERRKETHGQIYKNFRRASRVLMKGQAFGKRCDGPYTQGQCNAQPHRSTLPVAEPFLDLSLLFSVLPQFFEGFCSDTRSILETHAPRSLIVLDRKPETDPIGTPASRSHLGSGSPGCSRDCQRIR